MKTTVVRTTLAGLAGGAVFNGAMLICFRLIGFGWNGEGPLMGPGQSEKLMRVWAEEPVPRVVSDNPAPIIIGLVLFAVAHAFLYRTISAAWPCGIIPRAARLAFWLWLVVFVFWEFFTPFNQLHEPLHLLALELVFWAVIAAAESLTIVAVMEWKSGKAAAA